MARRYCSPTCRSRAWVAKREAQARAPLEAEVTELRAERVAHLRRLCDYHAARGAEAAAALARLTDAK